MEPARRTIARSSRFFARQLLKDLRLVGGYDQLYPQGEDLHARSPIQPSPVDLDDPVVLRNLSEPEVGKVLSTLQARRSTPSRSAIPAPSRDRRTHPAARHPPVPHRAARPFSQRRTRCSTKIVGEGRADGLELAFAAFLEDAPGRAIVREELHGRRLQARLCESGRRPFDLHARFHRPHRLTARSGSSRPKGARSWTFRRRWRGCANGALDATDAQQRR